jgi:hypothetical protein
VAAIFEPHIDDVEVIKYCEEEFGGSVLTIAQVLHKKSAEQTRPRCVILVMFLP